jgi:hypothetical protein
MMSKLQNPVLAKIRALILALRNADKEQLTEAQAELQKFGNGWLLSGDMPEFPGLPDSCLNDCDVTEPLRETIDTYLENYDSTNS